MTFDIERMCRLNGKRPTIREKWTAFYRLWRTSQHGDPRSNAIDCFRVLPFPGSWIALLNATGNDLECNNIMPIQIRRYKAEQDRDMRQDKMRIRLLKAIFEDIAI